MPTFPPEENPGDHQTANRFRNRVLAYQRNCRNPLVAADLESVIFNLDP